MAAPEYEYPDAFNPQTEADRLRALPIPETFTPLFGDEKPVTLTEAELKRVQFCVVSNLLTTVYRGNREPK